MKQKAFTPLEINRPQAAVAVPVTGRSLTGFTLIELLVVIAVIGLLASVVMVSLNSARGKARDARRRADVKQIQTAIELYFDQTGSFPVNRNSCCYYDDTAADFLQELVTNKYLARVPKDPQSPSRRYYYYDYGGACGYFVMMSPEDPSQNPDLGAVGGGSCGSASGDCDPVAGSRLYCLNGRR